MDMALFRGSTKITIGNGETTSFWQDGWCEKGPLRIQAPDLYKIATRKNRTVTKEVENDNWIRSIARLNTSIQLTQFIEIWDTLATTTLTQDQPDTISWSLTNDWVYSASSACKAQFHEAFPTFEAQKI